MMNLLLFLPTNYLVMCIVDAGTAIIASAFSSSECGKYICHTSDTSLHLY